MLKVLVPVLAILAALGLVVLTDKPAPPADFTFINRGDVTTLDLSKMSWMQDLRVARALFEGLVQNDVLSPNYTILPGVAERWEISDDKRIYTFHLRKDAMWNDRGKPVPVTAHDFVYSWRRAMLPDTVSDYAAQFLLIKGGQQFYDWRQQSLDAFKPDPGDSSRPLAETASGRLWQQTLTKFDDLVALKAIDDRTLRVELERPTPYFLDLCAFAVFYPVYPPLVRQYERPDPATGRLDIQAGWTKPPHLVTNGPFNLAVWRFKRDMRLEKNPLYWDRAGIHVDSIAIPSVEDPNAQVLAFNSGGVDWVTDVTPPYRRHMLAAKRAFHDECRARRAVYLSTGGKPGDPDAPPDIDALLAAGMDPIAIDRLLPSDTRKNISTFPAFGTYFYNFNCEPKLQDGRDNPFANPKVRRAFTMAVDKQRIAREVRGIGERTATTLIPLNALAGYTSPKGVPYDPAAARLLLAEAGYPDPTKFITVELLYNKDGDHDVIAQAVAKDWEENLGVTVSLQMREIKVFRDNLKRQDFMISRAGWFGDYGDPTTFLDLNKTGDGNNDRKYSSPAYDALLAQAASEPDPAARMELLSRAESIIVDEDLPLLPIFQYVQIYVFNPDRVSGISSHPRQQQDVFLIDVLGDGIGEDVPRAIEYRPAASTPEPTP